MSDIIQLLPDSVANQIAAGEVIQRPASVVKELVENAIDAGSSCITLSIKDAGKTLIQVTDNGCGMSNTDARMAFERHATSKIRNANDLFSLHTKGFRGEALASIAAISHTTLKTKRTEDELGTLIHIEGNKLIKQEPVSSGNGSVFSIRNLFYNVPARRKFLKSDRIEQTHILEEFYRIAIPHPDIQFILTIDDNEKYNLPKSNFGQRIVALFGNHIEKKIFPIKEQSELVSIVGYVAKPEHAKKSKPEQYLFINDRYFRSSYFNHAVHKAFEGLLPNKEHVSYFICLETQPDIIDVNIHPTKTEIKFENDSAIYAMLLATVKRSLGCFHISPSLDFDTEQSFDVPNIKKDQPISMPGIEVNPDFNPFDVNNNNKKSTIKPVNLPKQHKKIGNEMEWEKLYNPDVEITQEKTAEKVHQIIKPNWNKNTNTNQENYETEIFVKQLNLTYIITNIKSGLVIIDQHNAHERILYESYINTQNANISQKLLFTEKLSVMPAEIELIETMHQVIYDLGFEYEIDKNDNTIEIIAMPAESEKTNPVLLFKNMLAVLNDTEPTENINLKEQLIRTIASNCAIKSGQKLAKEEMKSIINQLFTCSNPNYTPQGKPIMKIISINELRTFFT